MRKGIEQIGIKDIARALKISIGTVDRALHGRSGVSEETKARVLSKATELGYSPNLAARALKLNRRLSIGAIFPKQISHFFDPLRAGIQAAATAALQTQISLNFHEYPRLGAGEQKVFDAVMQHRYDGILFVPGDQRIFDPIIHQFALSGTAMMCVGSDAPNSERVGSVTTHAYVSGGMAAELLGLRLAYKASVAVFSGALSTLDHAEKLRGFAATLATQAPHLTLLPVLESHDRAKDAYRQARALMQSRSRPEGLYLSTANSLPVLNALDELGLLGKIQIVATDLYRELIPLIEAGQLLATMHQRPYTQGKLAFEHLLAYLLSEDRQQPFVRLAPHIILRSNLSLFNLGTSNVKGNIEAELINP